MQCPFCGKEGEPVEARTTGKKSRAVELTVQAIDTIWSQPPESIWDAELGWNHAWWRTRSITGR